MYDADGNAISYTLLEDDVANYTKNINDLWEPTRYLTPTSLQA